MLLGAIQLFLILVFTFSSSHSYNYGFPAKRVYHPYRNQYNIRQNEIYESNLNDYQNGMHKNYNNDNFLSKYHGPLNIPPHLTNYIENYVPMRRTDEDRKFVEVGSSFLRSDPSVIKRLIKFGKRKPKIRGKHILHSKLKSDKVRRILNTPCKNTIPDKNLHCLTIYYTICPNDPVGVHKIKYGNMASFVSSKDNDNFLKTIESMLSQSFTPKLENLGNTLQMHNVHNRFKTNMPCMEVGQKICLHEPFYKILSGMKKEQDNIHFRDSNGESHEELSNEMHDQDHKNKFNINTDDHENQMSFGDNKLNIHTPNNKEISILDMSCLSHPKYNLDSYISYMFNKPVINIALKDSLLTAPELQNLLHYRSIINTILRKPYLVINHPNTVLDMLKYLQKANLKERFSNAYEYISNGRNNKRSKTQNEVEAVRLLGLFDNYFRLAKEKLFNSLKNNEHLRTKSYNLYMLLLISMLPTSEAIDADSSSEESSKELSDIQDYFKFITTNNKGASVEKQLTNINHLIDMQIFCGELINKYVTKKIEVEEPLVSVETQDIDDLTQELLSNYESKQVSTTTEMYVNKKDSEENFYFNDIDDSPAFETNISSEKTLTDIENTEIEEENKSNIDQMQVTSEHVDGESPNLMDRVIDKVPDSRLWFSKNHKYSESLNNISGQKKNMDKKYLSGQKMPYKQIFLQDKYKKEYLHQLPNKLKSIPITKAPLKIDNGQQKYVNVAQQNFKGPKKFTDFVLTNGNKNIYTTKIPPIFGVHKDGVNNGFAFNKLSIYDNKMLAPVTNAIGNSTSGNVASYLSAHKLESNSYNRHPSNRYKNQILYTVDHPEQTSPYYHYIPGFDVDLTLKSVNPSYLYNYAKIPPARDNLYHEYLNPVFNKKPFINQVPQFYGPQHIKTVNEVIYSNNHIKPWHFGYQDRINYNPSYLNNLGQLEHLKEREELIRRPHIPFIGNDFKRKFDYSRTEDRYNAPNPINDFNYNKLNFLRPPRHGFVQNQYSDLKYKSNFVPDIGQSKNHRLQHFDHMNDGIRLQNFKGPLPFQDYPSRIPMPNIIRESEVNKPRLIRPVPLLSSALKDENVIPDYSKLNKKLNKHSDGTNVNFVIDKSGGINYETNNALYNLESNFKNMFEFIKSKAFKGLPKKTEGTSSKSLSGGKEKDKHGLMALVALKNFRRNYGESMDNL